MKVFMTVLGLLALTAVGPALAADSAPAPLFLEQSVSSSACPSPVLTDSAPAQEGELPSWLTGEPLLWSEDLAKANPVAAGCAVYCRECGGCCVVGPSWCACC